MCAVVSICFSSPLSWCRWIVMVWDVSLVCRDQMTRLNPQTHTVGLASSIYFHTGVWFLCFPSLSLFMFQQCASSRQTYRHDVVLYKTRLHVCAMCVNPPPPLLPLTHACTLTCGLLAKQRSFLLPRRRRHWSPAKPRGWRTCVPFGYVRLRCSALSVKWDAKAKLEESCRRFRQSLAQIGGRWDPKNERVVWWRRDNRETHDTEREISLSSPAHQFCTPNWLERCWAHAFAALHAS